MITCIATCGNGRIMSAFVVIAGVAFPVADGAVQLFAPAQVASMLQGNRVRDGLDLRRGSDHTRLRDPALPATAVLGAILVTWAFWEVPSAPMSASGGWGCRWKSLSCFGARTWREQPLRARSPYPGPSAAHPVNQAGRKPSSLEIKEKAHVSSRGNHGKVGGENGADHLLCTQVRPRAVLVARRRSAGRTGRNWSTGDWNGLRQPSSGRSYCWRSKARRHVAGCLGAS